MPSSVLLALSVLAPSAIRLVILVAPWRAAVRARAHRATKCSFLMLIDLPFFRRDREKVGRGQGGCNFSSAYTNSSFSLGSFHFFATRLITRDDRLRVRWAGAVCSWDFYAILFRVSRMESSLLLKNEVIEATANQLIYFSIFPYRYPDGSGRRRTKKRVVKDNLYDPFEWFYCRYCTVGKQVEIRQLIMSLTV